MKYDDICSIVTHRAGLDRARADTAVKAVLQALGEQADATLFTSLVSALPPEFAKSPNPAPQATSRTATEFVSRVAELAELADQQARRPALATVAALMVAAPDTFPPVLQQLGDDYTALTPPPAELRDPATFTATVADRAGADISVAEAAVHATLDALAERITAGQAHDLAAYLPATLRDHLDQASQAATPFDYSQFLARIAGQRQAAETYAAAVFATVREAAPEPEIHDTLAQLPDDLARLFR